MSPSARSLFAPHSLPRQRKVPIGCVGAGFIMADCQLVAYREAGFNPIAITARRRKNAQQVADRHAIDRVYRDVDQLLADPDIEVLDLAVPPDIQGELLRRAAKSKNLRGILAQKPLGVDLADARRSVRACERAGITLAVNQNMRWDPAILAAKRLLDTGALGDPVLATIDMRAIPHWMPWQQRQGWLTLRIMSIHHLDTFRFWFGDPTRIYASTRPDPRTKFEHSDGIALYILEYGDGLRASGWDDVWTGPAREGAKGDIGIHWRIEGTRGMAHGTIGWPDYPKRTPSTLEYTTVDSGRWHRPKTKRVWFPDAFSGPMGELLCALEEDREPSISGADNLKTMALVDAAYRSARTHKAVELRG